MTLIKMFGLATVAAVAAMALVGVTSASAATSTQLCNSHTNLNCSNAATDVHMVLPKGTVGRLLNSLATVLCLGVLVESAGASVGVLGNPQVLNATAMSFTGCGTTIAHTNCTVAVTELPKGDLLKFGLDEGSVEALSGKINIQGCGLGLNCTLDIENLVFAVGAQHLTANENPVTAELGGKFLCPGESTLDGLLETLAGESRYVLR